MRRIEVHGCAIASVGGTGTESCAAAEAVPRHRQLKPGLRQVMNPAGPVSLLVWRR
jgi:hypothetical protein